MPTPFEDLYTAVKAMVAAVSAASPETITLAPSNYGTAFEVASANSSYQVQITPAEDYSDGKSSFPRADVVVLIHHDVAAAADEDAFIHQTLSHAADSLLDKDTWRSQAGLFQVEPDTEPDVSEGSRVGHVITFEFTSSVLMDAA